MQGRDKAAAPERCAVLIWQSQQVHRPHPGGDFIFGQVSRPVDELREIQFPEPSIQFLQISRGPARVHSISARANEYQPYIAASFAQACYRFDQWVDAFAGADEAKMSEQEAVVFCARRLTSAIPVGRMASARANAAANWDQPAQWQIFQARVVLVVSCDDAGGGPRELHHDPIAQPARLGEEVGITKIVKCCDQRQREYARQEVDVGRHVKCGRLKLQVDHIKRALAGPVSYLGQAAGAPCPGRGEGHGFAGRAASAKQRDIVAEIGKLLGQDTREVAHAPGHGREFAGDQTDIHGFAFSPLRRTCQ